MYRTHNCVELDAKHIGQTVKIAGWIQGIRDIGAVVFAVVRDFYGITQVAISDVKIIEQIKSIPTESTILVEGQVIQRSSPNPNIPTGQIEIVPNVITVLGECKSNLPFEILNSEKNNEDIRLRYRYLDLRNPNVKKNIVLRSQIISDLRKAMIDIGFLEIATPILTSSSPEGARDYIVPSRVHKGKFYALPQAPQQYKQLLMCSGFDRYFQIAPCFRDEDARADRSPGEFYQLDMEMAFAEQDDVFEVIEKVLPPLFEKYSNWTVDKTPFERIPYLQAMEKYGTDKPDLRNPLIVKDAKNLFDKCGFEPLQNVTVKAIVVKNFKGTRKQIDEIVSDLTSKEYCKNVYWFKVGIGSEFSGGIAKFATQNKDSIIKELDLHADDLVMLVSNKTKDIAQKESGRLRTAIATKLDLIQKNVFKFCWIVDFPMYEFDEDSKKIIFSHNPFSMPQGGMNALKNKNPLDILAYQYDIVCNGIELSSGAVRNHNPDIMVKAFEIAGISINTIEEKFPAMFNAFKFGAPPHAGVAPGVDRMVMLICDTPNIREVIAYPMNKSAQDLMMNAPSTVSKSQLDDVHIQIKDNDKKSSK